MNFIIEHPKKVHKLCQFGGTALGHTYEAYDLYLTKDGKPFLYRMGEFHFSRVSAKDWERELLKMKDGGINVVSTYLFWIHHEELEGEFRFDGNFDLRRFCLLCKKLDLPLFLRPGPWAHGEARNGGFPDWLIQKCGGKEHLRVSEYPYLDYVNRFFTRVYEEIKDCMDVLVGIQVENELQRNAEHLETLRQMLNRIGFRAPFWTATGWGPAGSGAQLPNGTLLPVYGGYPEAPWAAHTDPIYGNKTFHFSHDSNNASIGTDVMSADEGFIHETQNATSDKFPYLTCEVGGGNQVTYHRRPIISAQDVVAGVICRLGSGANGIGYYMYHGGKNPIGKTTMQESRATGYKNDYPIYSYDFQAPIGECGQIRESYDSLRSIHEFLEYFGEKLALMPSYLPDIRPTDLFDTSILRCAVRSDGKSGFLFVNNHAHGEKMKDQDVEICIKLAEGNRFVRIPLKVAAGACGVMPFGLSLGGKTVNWVSAMPVFRSKKEIIFEEINGIKPYICLSDGIPFPFVETIEIDDVKLSIRSHRSKKEELLQELPVTVAERVLKTDVFSHLENRDGSMLETADERDYVVSVPIHTKSLIIEAQGNAVALYNGNTLLSDFFLYGERMYADLSEINLPASLTLKILPLTEENKKHIYFETDMPIGHVCPKVYVLRN